MGDYINDPGSDCTSTDTVMIMLRGGPAAGYHLVTDSDNIPQEIILSLDDRGDVVYRVYPVEHTTQDGITWVEYYADCAQ